MATRLLNLENVKRWLIKNNRGGLYDLVFYLYDLISGLDWIYDSRARVSRASLNRYKNKYKGQTCFIIGNGPSLNKTDLSKLKDKYTFGLNRIFLLFDRLGFETTFFVSVNPLVVEQSLNEFQKIKSRKFFSWKVKNKVFFNKRTIFLRTLARQLFSKNITQGVWEGATVTYVALQLAYHMGFKKVVLVGVDHYYKTKGKAHKVIVSRGKDDNHFDPNYFVKGFKWNLPDLETSRYAYELARKAFDKDGREIVDATVGGKLKIFRKVNYYRLFK